MSLVEDARVAAAPSAWDHGLPDLVLGPLGTADLMLAVAGVLPPGQVLGAPVAQTPAAEFPDGEPREIGVALPGSEAAAAALAAGGLVLRDEEHTPLAHMVDLRVLAPGTCYDGWYFIEDFHESFVGRIPGFIGASVVTREEDR